MNALVMFDAMNAASDSMHKAIKTKELRRKIAGIGSRCGDCNHWMKSRTCPRERNVGGMSRGPSCDDVVMNCAVFVIKPAAIERRARLSAELAKTEGATCS